MLDPVVLAGENFGELYFVLVFLELTKIIDTNPVNNYTHT